MRIVALTLAALACFLTPAAAKPMGPATLERALASPLILLASYESCDPEGASYFGGVATKYKVIKVWKGKIPKGPKSLQISYAFTDGSACIAPKPWVFSKKMLPKPGATFVLFLTPAQPGIYRTYRGTYGRWPADHLKKDESKSLRTILNTPPAACSKCSKKHARPLRLLPKGMIWENRCANGESWRELTFAFEREKKADKKTLRK